VNFAADAYAQGICNTAAGSEIEVLVDTINATLGDLDLAMEFFAGQVVGNGKYDRDDEEHEEAISYIQARKDKWEELRDEIVELERANGETTSFREDT
jgi:hypothetical protein